MAAIAVLVLNACTSVLSTGNPAQQLALAVQTTDSTAAQSANAQSSSGQSGPGGMDQNPVGTPPAPGSNGEGPDPPPAGTPGSSFNQPPSTTPGSSSNQSPSGSSGGSSDSGRSTATGFYTLDGGSANQSGQTYQASSDDESAIYVSNGANLTLYSAAINTSGNTSSSDNNSFYGLNAGVLATSGSTVTVIVPPPGRILRVFTPPELLPSPALQALRPGQKQLSSRGLIRSR